MATQTFVDVRKFDATLEYRNMSDLLADFRKYIEADAGTPIERLEVNGALFLHDLCQFLQLGLQQRQKVLGRNATQFVAKELAAQVRLPVIH